MIRSGSIWIFATALALAGDIGTVRAQEPSEARIQELIRQAAERMAAGQSSTASQQAAGQTPAASSDTRPTVQMSLDDAVRLALERNLDIAVQRLNPQINDIAIASIRSIYHPSLTSTVYSQSQTTPAHEHARWCATSRARASVNDSSNATPESRRASPGAAATLPSNSITAGCRRTA